ncbi:MAG: 50S ribosomal protein L7/L12 [Actinomycetia bacterium]|nr:50S ribosomal protein L7/L12 [Actinomycetes bacterium]
MTEKKKTKTKKKKITKETATKKVTKEKKKISAKEIIEAVENMTVKELAELVDTLEERFGVVAATPVTIAASTTKEEVKKEEEKTEFDVVLTNIGEKKIQVIKEVRTLTRLGLKEAKAVVDNAPEVVLKGISKEEAESAKKKLEDVGATVEIK